MKHAILASFGTDGDVYPFLALGIELRKRGYRVTLATHEYFAKRAQDGGLEFRALVSDAETKELWEQPDFWHPIKAALVIGRWGSRLLQKHYDALKELAAGDGAFLIASPGVVAARLVQEETKTPLVSVFLQPWMIPSIDAPPRMMGGVSLPGWAPRFAGHLYYRLIDAIGVRMMGDDFKRLRASIGLSPVRDMFRWWFSPELVLGLFPTWFGSPQGDWPRQIRLTGFPLKENAAGVVPKALADFCSQGKPVVAVTFGTGMMHAKELFGEAIKACQELDACVVLLTKFRSQLADELPAMARHCEFASFDSFFPLCAAVVHHGGIGTTSNALAAGTPQLIIPFAYDQLDNAVRVKKLDAGNYLKPKQRNAAAMAAALKGLLTPETAASARRVAQNADVRSGIERAGNEIDAFTKTRFAGATLSSE